MKYLVVFFAFVQISSAKSLNEFNRLRSKFQSLEEFDDSIAGLKSYNEFNKLRSKLLSLEEFSNKKKSVVAGSFEEDSKNLGTDRFLRPPKCGVSNATKSRLFGGNFATEHQFPWIVALGYKFSSFNEMTWSCAGALITEKHVLTAAHCIYQNEQYLTTARVGTLDILNDDTYNDYESGQDISIDKKIVHEKWNQNNAINDIGMVTLKRKASASMVWPICLPVDTPLSKQNYVGKTVTVAGWGVERYDGPPNPLLQYASLKVFHGEKCMKQFSFLEPGHNIMCTADLQWKQDVCFGNSGSPLMYKVTKNDTRYYLVGLVSLGQSKCGIPGNFAVFTGIVPYLEWIGDQISKN